jgi:hypothetical protein
MAQGGRSPSCGGIRSMSRASGFGWRGTRSGTKADGGKVIVDPFDATRRLCSTKPAALRTQFARKRLAPQGRREIHAERLTSQRGMPIFSQMAPHVPHSSCLHHATEILLAAAPVGALMPAAMR